jgi:hypothetical protein
MMLKRLLPSLHYALRRYFASGWAFLIPYLAVYLLYYATDWPVNPASDSESGEIPASAVPSLLHVYWALHALHVALALLASASAKMEEGMVKGEKNAPGGDNLGHALHHQQLRAMRSELLATTIRRFRSLLPLHSSIFRRPFTLHPSPFTLQSSLFWLLLALIFYIPGVYLEWPSDPWEHLRRINEWHATATVGGHSCWYKSAYFIPYSLLSWATGLRQLFWLDFYYTGICLLLCWQYYRLARACGLGERASMIFVLTQAILFGNNIFSFYRYYGISSSIYAQIGAVAITRIALEFATRGTSQEQHSGWPASENIRARAFWHWPTLLKAILPAIACLVPFVAFNHQQGIGIAALGVLAILIWRTIEWRRSALWWLIAGTLIFNALFLWLYPKPPVIEIYRTNGALNAWYGFNIFDFTHPIGDRMLQIVSAFGLVNILAALLLLRRNHVSAWLTITPLIVLSLPCISIPLATALSRNGENVNYIITFQRMIFAIPIGLALVHRVKTAPEMARPLIAMTICIPTVISPPPAPPFYNRIWNTLSTPPRDLSLRDNISIYSSLPQESNFEILTTISGQAVAACTRAQLLSPRGREIGTPVSEHLERTVLLIEDYKAGQLPPPRHYQKPPSPKNLIPNPKANIPIDWIAIRFASPLFQPTVQSPPGTPCWVFTAALIPISKRQCYKLEIQVRQSGNTTANTYLAVAWYDESKTLIESYPPPPKGAGNPRRWHNGIFSYFASISTIPQGIWTPYTVRFGLGEEYEIPQRAAYLRVGGLLNWDATPSVEVQLTNFTLVEVDPPLIKSAYSTPTSTCSFASQAAQLSRHWPAQQALYENAGINEFHDLLGPIDSTSSGSGKPATRK